MRDLFVRTHDRASSASLVLVAAVTTPLVSHGFWLIPSEACNCYPSSCFPHVLPIYEQKGPIVKSVVLEPRTMGNTKSRQTGRCTDGVDSTVIKTHPHRPTPTLPYCCSSCGYWWGALGWRRPPAKYLFIFQMFATAIYSQHRYH